MKPIKRIKLFMYLFIDTLSNPAYLCLFDKDRTIIDSSGWDGKQHEFDQLIETIDSLLQKNNLPYRDLQGIISIVGPGGFTGTRINTLVINTLAHSFGIPLYPITVADFFALQDAPLPWIIGITKKEVLLWETSERNNYKGVLVTDLAPGKYSSTSIDFGGDSLSIYPAQDYTRVIKNLILTDSVQQVTPLYAKDPNITLRK